LSIDDDSSIEAGGCMSISMANVGASNGMMILIADEDEIHDSTKDGVCQNAHDEYVLDLTMSDNDDEAEEEEEDNKEENKDHGDGEEEINNKGGLNVKMKAEDHILLGRYYRVKPFMKSTKF
jgi:hypothetical protein